MFLFNHISEPTSPSWDHDPATAAKATSRFSTEKACICSQTDFYKEWYLRRQMWDHLIGATPPNR